MWLEKLKNEKQHNIPKKCEMIGKVIYLTSWVFLDADLLMLLCQDMFAALEKLHEVDCWQSVFRWC